MGTTGSTGSLAFTGISSFSSDFQSILSREDQIAALPLAALHNQQTANSSKKQALVSLNPVVATLAADVAALGTLASNQGISASSSSSAVSVVNTGATSTGSYTLSNITIASAANETSLTGYADATTAPVWVAGQNKFTLTSGSNTYNLDLTGNNNLNGLADAINSSGAPVTASVINSGSASYLSLQANNVGGTTLTLDTNPQQVSLISNTGSGAETSLFGYADASTTQVSNSGTVNLSVGGGAVIPLDITANNNLNGLRDAINAAAAGVTASITTSGGQSFLQLSADDGTSSITLNDTAAASPVNLITNSNQGVNASFTLNGNIPVNQSTNTFSSLIPGVSFTLQQNNAGSVNLSLNTDSSQLSFALQTFATDYNALVDQVNQQIGSGAGVLGGSSLISNISDDLRQLSGYLSANGSTVRSLSDLGLTFDDTGKLTLDATVVQGFSATQLSDAFKFLGSSNSGFAAFASNFTQLSDPIQGFIQIQEDSYDSSNTRLNDQIASLTQRINLTHTTDLARLQQADALVAQLESEQNIVSSSISSLNYVLYGKQTNANGL